jgi:hypothetical protein
MKILLLAPVLAALFALSCPPPTPPPPPPTGFSIRTLYQEFVNNIPTTPPVPMPGTGVNTHYLFNTQPLVGTNGTCNGVTDFLSNLQCPDAKIPAVWEFSFVSGPCFGISDATDVDIQPGAVVGYVCEIHFQRFFVTPSSMDVNAPPATVELTGEGIQTTYGMPRIQFVNTETGEIVGTTTASAVSANGTWVQAPIPYLGFAYSGSYVAVVHNVAADGSFVGVGGDWVDFYGNDEPPPPPPDGEPCGTGSHPMPCEVEQVY